MAAHWLMKTEPDVFSIDDLARKKREPWTGVRNYQARNFMRAMKRGDKVLLYHSSCEPHGVAGLAEVCRESYPDPTAWDRKSPYFDPRSPKDAPRWFMVDVAFVARFEHVVELDELRRTPGLEDMWVLRRGMRLSVQPVTPAEYALVARLGRRRRAA
jgi:predicted RNA-binding protein with PUA-like domain